MIKVSFYLVNPSRDTSPITASVSFSSRTYKYPCGVSVPVKHWLKVSQRAKESMEFKDGPDINLRLEYMATAIRSTADNFFTRTQVPSPQEFSRAVEDRLYPAKHKSGSFVEFMDGYYPTLTRGHNTQRRYVTTINQLKDLEKKRKGKITFSDFDMHLLNEVKRYFSEQGLSANYLADFIKNVKVFFRAAKELGLHSLNLPDKFIAPTVDSDSIYLTIDELTRIRNLNITDDLILDALGAKVLNVTGNINRMRSSLMDCRDRFLIGAFTAMRYSDYSSLRNLKSTDEYITRVSQKTGVKTVIPMHPIVKDILTDRANKIPDQISTQKMNDQLKVLGRLAGLEDEVEVTEILVNGKKRTTYKKYELLTTHTARRSGCTNMYLAGIDAISIMSFSGHKTTKSFMKYIKASQQQMAEKVKDHPFFTQQKPSDPHEQT